MRRAYVHFTLLAIAALAVISCGIPQSTIILAPVEAVNVELAGSVAVFEHDSDNYPGDSFLGYEVYYKFYTYDDDPTDGPFAVDREQINESSRGTARLESLGFHRITRKGDSSSDDRPLIKIDLSEPQNPYEIRLQFPVAISASYTIVATWLDGDPTATPPSQVSLVRDPRVDPLVNELTFEPDGIHLDPPDEDVPNGTTAFGGKINMGIAVLAYGADFTALTGPVYSEPVMIDRPLDILVQE
jgi:hypothetical protein